MNLTEDLIGSLCQEINTKAARIATLEAKLADAGKPPEVDAWKTLVRIAYAEGGDGARNIFAITSHYNALRDKLAAAETRIAGLRTELDRLTSAADAVQASFPAGTEKEFESLDAPLVSWSELVELRESLDAALSALAKEPR